MADKIDIFTAVLRTEFERGFNAVAEPAPIDKAIEVIPSTAREENYAWLSPVPAIARYQGYRRYGKISEIKYKVSNLEFDAAFEVLNRDIEDDQTGGYTRKAKDLSLKAKLFPGRECLRNLATGKTTTCFDGSAFFADSHTIGTGDNKIAGTAAATDGVTHNMVVMVTAGSVKPLLWQNRKGPKFMTDAGTPEALKAKTSKYWIDMEGAAAFGFWWDAVLVEFSNTPTVAEIQTTLGSVEAQFRSFKVPLNLAGDTPEYLHEQTEFSEKTVLTACSPKLFHIMRQALTLSLINNTENVFKGWSQLLPTNFLNTVS